MFVMREEEEENEDEDEDDDGNEDEIGREREEEMMMGIDDLHIEDDDGSSFYETHSRGPRRLRERERERERRGWRNAFGGLRSGAGSSGSGSGSFGREGQSASSSSGEGGYNRREQSATMNVPPSPMGGPGSRTFLIYVIGGYYPPDHSIVTGGPDNLESFEALLELVEMLGSAKASTASKDDIEKSGLEVIKRSQLEMYEREKKVSSNCVERCLICLDEYEEEDEIRVMNCRHAFHRGCVDTWLQTGKNNCPACRSTGVASTSTSTSTSSTTQAQAQTAAVPPQPLV
ncbi:hypothetical protein AGABI1DRAFT_116356 [Agaricus bisporus var. burnettii JB137-S8]|uniref:RING-type domain-containing protein n=1 Tax=Agaricus bisporus var. burnettii (strain JB137-S8 / ATCC MYA-4627 / FGSC 10392) TaxID=597362 RepID=K5WXH9_AGABU|nr:uncharacterized protein AGABI1DRAFT_116356 [Agaricus bisporus var. burnettii JB137-S8]EKM75523.1 hypothetical protein AGABI1DRAFT_116356 [Agaricus bisporus var. burnettii JB137-S8]